jgi:cytochrome c
MFDPAGTNGTGPGLFGVVGRKVASHPGYMYSQPMMDEAAKTPVWTYDSLFEYLKNPQKMVPGTKMTFVGLPKAEDRIAIIAYLHTLGSTLPIPPPNPAAAAAPAEAAAAPAADAAPPAKG